MAIDRSAQEPPPVDGARWISLGDGAFALVDACDFDRLSRFAWRRLHGTSIAYAVRSARSRKEGVSATILMHREILGAGTGEQVDHINQNGLDNRRANLRLGSCADNCANTRARRGSASPFKGAHKYGNRWESSITADGKRHRLGHFDTDVEAAQAYDDAARELLGPRGRFNFPQESELPAVRQ